MYHPTKGAVCAHRKYAILLCILLRNTGNKGCSGKIMRGEKTKENKLNK